MKIEYKTPTSVRDLNDNVEGQNVCRAIEKRCICCKSVKLQIEFNSKQSRCKVCQSEYKRNYYLLHKGHISAKSSAWRKQNPSRNTKLKRLWERRSRQSPQRRMIVNIRSRLGKLLKGHPRGKTFRLLGCDRETLKKHLSSKFLEGMTWENYGQWHVDHIFPLSKADLLNPEELRRVCHYTNLQPLWAIDNLKKASKIG